MLSQDSLRQSGVPFARAVYKKVRFGFGGFLQGVPLL